MDDGTEKISIVKLTEESRTSIDDLVAREFPLTIILDDEELVTLLCSPRDLRYLTVGFLFSEALLESKSDIKKIIVDEERGVVRVDTTREKVGLDDLIFKRMISSGCGRGATFYSAVDIENQKKIESKTMLSTGEVLALVKDFQQRSEIYRSTGGVHSAALCDKNKIIVFNEDIGRHNAIDKVFGECVLKDIPTEGRIVVTSGRISSEILLKVARRNIPIIISKSAPTDLGVKMADNLGVTILGFVRGKRVNVYTHDWRIASDGRQR